MLPDSAVGIEDDSMTGGAPAKEIEVTPEMIEAGVRALELRWTALRACEDDAIEEAVRAIICAAEQERLG